MSPRNERKLNWLQGEKQPLPVLAGLRAALGYSQKEFAEHIGASQSSVSDWERGQYIPSHRKAYMVTWLQAQAFVAEGLTPAELRVFHMLTPDMLQQPYELYLSGSGTDPAEVGTNGSYPISP